MTMNNNRKIKITWFFLHKTEVKLWMKKKLLRDHDQYVITM